MIITKRALPRRTFLRGVGATLALPLLDAMVPALSAQSATRPVRRLGFIYLPNGVSMNFKGVNYWKPIGEGRNFEFSQILAPFAPFRERMVVVSGDSDLVPALQMVKARFPKKKIIVYVPSRDYRRGAATELRGAADQDRTLPLALLSKCQLPAGAGGDAVYRPGLRRGGLGRTLWMGSCAGRPGHESAGSAGGTRGQFVRRPPCRCNQDRRRRESDGLLGAVAWLGPGGKFLLRKSGGHPLHG